MDKVKSTMVPEGERMKVVEKLFGISFPLRVEPIIFGTAGKLSKDYTGAMWDFYQLSNGGFYMAPQSTGKFHVIADNYFEGDLTGDALGITACLYAYSQMSFANTPMADACGEQYHLLREFMYDHPECGAIAGAID